MIMSVHPILVLLPILGLLVLPCVPNHLENGLKLVANLTVNNSAECDDKLCSTVENCSMAILNEEKSLCFLISCPNNTQNSSCGNVTNLIHLLAKPESVHVDNNDTRELVPPQLSSSTTSSQSSPDGSSSNVIQPSTTEANISISSTSTTTKPATLQYDSTTKATTNLQTTSTEKATTVNAVPKPAITETIPTTPDMPSTTTTTPKPTTTTTPKPTTTTTPKPTTTTPKPSSTTTSTTTTSATVAQTIIPKQPSSPSPSGTKLSVSISPLVPKTPPSNSSTKPEQTSPIPTSSDEKLTPTTPKTSISPSVVAPKLPKDILKGDQAMVEVAGDPLTSHLLNTSSLLAVLLFGLLFFVVTVVLFVKQAYESYKRKDYTQVDYLINGMYADSGV
ncbi:salivary glue protein Sgs-3 [Ctenopharyngodon idella]|uniref:salivary glue protein Sgs-3 n=1 Tax=Ctenopharyngodon idella TaxID=7959 RepID=UPI00222FEACC|nr:salivary glue protein Sgs-3 [Ctenopharyngodon idella]